MKKTIILLLAVMILSCGVLFTPSSQKVEADVNMYPVAKMYCRDNLYRLKIYTAYVGDVYGIVTGDLEEELKADPQYACLFQKMGPNGTVQNYNQIYPIVKNDGLTFWFNPYTDVSKSDITVDKAEAKIGDILTVYYYNDDDKLLTYKPIVVGIEGDLIKLKGWDYSTMGGVAYNSFNELVGISTKQGIVRINRIDSILDQNTGKIMDSGYLMDLWRGDLYKEVEALKNEAKGKDYAKDQIISEIKAIMDYHGSLLSSMLANSYQSYFDNFINQAIDDQFKPLATNTVMQNMNGIVAELGEIKNNQLAAFINNINEDTYMGLEGEINYQNNTFVYGRSNNLIERDADFDGDGLSNYHEYLWNTNPYNKDTDGDGYNDGEEAANGYSPILPSKIELPLR